VFKKKKDSNEVVAPVEMPDIDVIMAQANQMLAESNNMSSNTQKSTNMQTTSSSSFKRIVTTADGKTTVEESNEPFPQAEFAAAFNNDFFQNATGGLLGNIFPNTATSQPAEPRDRIVVCSGCGAKGIVTAGTIARCEYCNTPME